MKTCDLSSGKRARSRCQSGAAIVSLSAIVTRSPLPGRVAQMQPCLRFREYNVALAASQMF